MALSDRESLHVYETKMRLIARAGYCCEVCGRRMEPIDVQLAHRIPQSYVDYYGKEIIHHDCNLAAVCSLACNKVIDLGDHEDGHKEVLAEILYYGQAEKDWYEG